MSRLLAGGFGGGGTKENLDMTRFMPVGVLESAKGPDPAHNESNSPLARLSEILRHGSIGLTCRLRPELRNGNPVSVQKIGLSYVLTTRTSPEAALELNLYFVPWASLQLPITTRGGYT